MLRHHGANLRRSIRIGLVNYNRGPGCYIHSLGHGMESALGGTPIAVGRPRFNLHADQGASFAPFANLDLDAKYGLHSGT